MSLCQHRYSRSVSHQQQLWAWVRQMLNLPQVVSDQANPFCSSRATFPFCHHLPVIRLSSSPYGSRPVADKRRKMNFYNPLTQEDHLCQPPHSFQFNPRLLPEGGLGQDEQNVRAQLGSPSPQAETGRLCLGLSWALW